jgi:hypothetical protein
LFPEDFKKYYAPKGQQQQVVKANGIKGVAAVKAGLKSSIVKDISTECCIIICN